MVLCCPGGNDMAGHVCPWWLGYFHLGPIRRMLQNPVKMLAPYTEPGMRVVDIGCAMGFFTLELAKLVGSAGRVYAIDLQPRMIRTLVRRAGRAGLSERIDARVCESDSLCADDLDGKINMVLAFYVIHEIPDVPGLLNQIHSMVVPGGKLFIVEPKGHVSESGFEDTLAVARETGFATIDRPPVRRSRSALLERR